VKKYRRSAAGGGVQPQYKEDGTEWKRTLEDLETSVDYLLTVFSNQQSDGMEEKTSLVKTVNFVDDRLRAVQVDLTTLLGSMSDIDAGTLNKVRGIQVKLVRYNILTQHLFSDLGTDKYEWKFANTALTTAISSFFAAYHGPNSERGDENNLDEVMSYAALLHIAMVMKNNEAALPQTSSTGQQCGLASDGGDGMSVILNLYRKHVQKGSNAMKNGYFPKYQWALNIAGAIESGEFLSALKLLAPKTSDGDNFDDEFRWKVIARCCIAQAIPLIRIGLMRRYNKSFGKQEKVRDDNLVQLLYLPSPDAAINFCERIGIPTVSSIEEGRIDRVVMKAAPISITGDHIVTMTNPGRSMDEFVFGKPNWMLCNPPGSKKRDPLKGMSSLQRAMTKMKVRDDPNEIDIEDDVLEEAMMKMKVGDDPNEIDIEDDEPGDKEEIMRKDEFGVLILPPGIVSNLIR